MKFLSPAFVLTLVCAVAALGLAFVNAETLEPIAEQQRLFTLRSVQAALPSPVNIPDQDVVVIEDGDERVCVYRGRNEAGEITGIALAGTQGGGYSGNITILVGLDPEGQVVCEEGEGSIGLQILAHAETPGLGSLVEGDGWRRQFCGHALEEGESFWRVQKDGGGVDAVTGATISSRTVTAGILGRLELFERHRDEIMTGSAGTCGE